MWCYAARAGSITCYRKGGFPMVLFVLYIGAIYGYIPNVFFHDVVARVIRCHIEFKVKYY